MFWIALGTTLIALGVALGFGLLSNYLISHAIAVKGSKRLRANAQSPSWGSD